MAAQDYLDEIDSLYEIILKECGNIAEIIKGKGLAHNVEEMFELFPNVATYWKFRFILNDAKDLYYCHHDYNPEYVTTYIRRKLTECKKLREKIHKTYYGGEKILSDSSCTDV